MKVIKIVNDKVFKGADILKVVVMHGGEQGVTLGEQRKRLRILDALDGLALDAKELALEDADHGLLAILYENHRFGMVHRGLIELGDNIKNAESGTVSKVEPIRAKAKAS